SGGAGLSASHDSNGRHGLTWSLQDKLTHRRTRINADQEFRPLSSQNYPCSSVAIFPSGYMLPDPQDTIVALASAPGPGARAIIRLAGPQAYPIATKYFTTEQEI